MNQFVLQQGHSPELELFPHIVELGAKKNSAIQLNSFPESATDTIRIYYVNDGKFEWHIHGHSCLLYPGDVALILPGQSFGSQKGFLEIGSLSWMHIAIGKLDNGKMVPGKWSSLSESESMTIGKILLLNNSGVLSKLNEAGRILQYIQGELFNQQIGYCTRVNQLIDELLIIITRQLTRQSNPARDFPKAFMQLEQTLRQNLSHQWTVEEMAAIVGMGTTLFNEKVKNYSGFSPINYLINIRISEAIKLLKKEDISLTDIALDTGFYSSQHFSTTFKKLTGYTPSEFRKNHLRNN
ncbi:MAG: helix-turn-helix transcriptional regulator [Chitinophagaceae bacterium]|nr:helix-turn-helix transcriptional regulator [Chitinophagaceae bacterium]